jgi:hypothetical protein
MAAVHYAPAAMHYLRGIDALLSAVSVHFFSGIFRKRWPSSEKEAMTATFCMRMILAFQFNKVKLIQMLQNLKTAGFVFESCLPYQVRLRDFWFINTYSFST